MVMSDSSAQSPQMLVWRMRMAALETDLRKLTDEMIAHGDTPSEELDERASKLRFAIDQLMRECPDPRIRESNTAGPRDRRDLLVQQVCLFEKMVELTEKAKSYEDTGQPRPDWLERDIDNYYGQLLDNFKALGQAPSPLMRRP